MNPNWKSTIPENSNGIWKVERFTVGATEAMFHAISQIGKGVGDRSVPEGEYTRLMRGSTVVMSDTPSEYRDHRYFISKASGKVLVAGLGLGCVTRCVASKPDVTEVVVVERSPEVIAMVWPHIEREFGSKVKLVVSDINEYRPAKGEKFDCAWYDIWDYLSSGNLPEMTRIARRFAKTVVGYRGFWGKELCLVRQKQEKKDEAFRAIFRQRMNNRKETV